MTLQNILQKILDIVKTEVQKQKEVFVDSASGKFDAQDVAFERISSFGFPPALPRTDCIKQT